MESSLCEDGPESLQSLPHWVSEPGSDPYPLVHRETTERHRCEEGEGCILFYLYFLTFHIEMISDFQNVAEIVQEFSICP